MRGRGILATAGEIVAKGVGHGHDDIRLLVGSMHQGWEETQAPARRFCQHL